MSDAMDCIRNLDHARDSAMDCLKSEAANAYHQSAINEVVRHIEEAIRIMETAREDMWNVYRASVKMGGEE